MKIKAGEPIDPERWEWPEPEQLPADELDLEWLLYSVVGIIAASAAVGWMIVFIF